MRRQLLALAAATLGMAAAADVYVPGTKVSYRLGKDPITDANTSSVYLDEADSDTYVEFSCDKGRMVFFLNADTPLLSEDDYDGEVTPPLTYRVDAQTPRTVPTLNVNKSDEPDDTSYLNSLAVEDKNDPVIFAAFKNAAGKVALRVTRSSGRDLTMTFATKGFAQALAKVNTCK